jgi:TPR repeat protein
VQPDWLCAGTPSTVIEPDTGKQIETKQLARALYGYGQIELLHRCDAGFAEDCYRLAEAYVTVPPCAGGLLEEERSAVSVLQRACDVLRFPRACTRLADAHERGQLGLPRDPRRAAELRAKASANRSRSK